MANVVVVGAQWGDEGKGKIVDWLSVSADVVVRFQGGHNAGHTLVVDGQVYKLALLPSGIVRPGKLSVIGNGVVLDPYHLVEEIEKIRGLGVEVTPKNLKIAENVPLILSLHRELDAHRESAEIGGVKIGTTKRGIGPAYEDKVGRRAIRLMDLAEPEFLDGKIARLLAHHDPLWRGMGLAPPTAEAIKDELVAVAPKVLPYMAPTFELLDRERRAGKRILFEGAQGALLDVDHGTYPYVTSSNTVAANAATGSGLGPRAIGYVLGIAKAYTTRVGGGPFPTELDDEIGRLIGQRGNEFGTNTGRPRRCGWFDAVLTRQMRQDLRHRRRRADQARHSRRLRRDQGRHALSSRRQGDRLSPGLASRAGAHRTHLRNDRRLAGRDRGRALVGRSAGAGDQIRAPHRGTDRRAGRVALDEPEAGRYDSCA